MLALGQFDPYQFHEFMSSDDFKSLTTLEQDLFRVVASLHQQVDILNSRLRYIEHERESVQQRNSGIIIGVTIAAFVALYFLISRSSEDVE